MTIPEDRETFAPLVLFEYDHKPGTYCLMLSDTHMGDPAAAVFQENGYEGGGYSWTGAARSAVAAHAPELTDRLAYDPEAGLFVAYGTNPDALARLGTLLREAHEDPAVLRGYVWPDDYDRFD